MKKFSLLLLASTFFWQAACNHGKVIPNKSKFTKEQQYYQTPENQTRTDPQEQYTYLPEITVYFQFNRFNLTPEAQEKLQSFYKETLQNQPNISFYVEGNTDTSGTQEYNLVLSEKRANSVIQYLQYLGADSGRFNVLARGELNPIADDSQHPELNRRVIVYRKSKN